MEELWQGIYDDECAGLMYEEINALHGFSEEGEPTDKDTDQTSDSDSDLEGLGDLGNHKETEAEAEIDAGIEVCFS
jgi:hypothetical protein